MFAIHAVLGEVFHIDFAVAAQSHMHGEEVGINSLDLHTRHQFAAKVQSCRWSHHSAFVFGEDGLILLGIFGFSRSLNILW